MAVILKYLVQLSDRLINASIKAVFETRYICVVRSIKVERMESITDNDVFVYL